jgi:hypothetical protein
MTGTPASPPARLTTGQAAGWAVALLVVAALVVLFFVYDTAARPMFGALPGMGLHG